MELDETYFEFIQKAVLNFLLTSLAFSDLQISTFEKHFMDVIQIRKGTKWRSQRKPFQTFDLFWQLILLYMYFKQFTLIMRCMLTKIFDTEAFERIFLKGNFSDA